MVNENESDLDFYELVKYMKKIADEGNLGYVKWTCEGCGERVTCDKPNAIFTEGYCHTEKKDGSECGYTTFPEKYGVLLIITPKKGSGKTK